VFKNTVVCAYPEGIIGTVDVRVTGNAPATRSILLVTTRENTQYENTQRGWCANLARARSVSQTPSADSMAALVASGMALGLGTLRGLGRQLFSLCPHSTLSNEPSL
jgi:hypothetical protein